MKQFGVIERVFIMRSEKTGQSKGYGFVEYLKNPAVNFAKGQLPKKYGNFRVEFANPDLFEYYDLQSQTLSVKKFPPETTSEQIEEIINKHVQVPFCKVRSDLF